jgi:putative CocE/NonD family hydrolase
MQQDWHKLISKPVYEVDLHEDVWVTMRDGVRLSVDIYRPRAEGKFPGLVSFSWYGKDSQKLPTGPEYRISDAPRGNGGHECGEQGYFVPRGYVQVIPDVRGIGKSEGEYTVDWAQDGYDLIEWIAEQQWCNGNIGLAGMSAFGWAQYFVAATRPPHLKAIFPFEALTDRYRDHHYHGGIFNHYFQLRMPGLIPHVKRPVPYSFREFSEEELAEKLKELRSTPDIQCTPFLYLITLAPHLNPVVFDMLMHPFDGPYYQRVSAYPRLKDIKTPTYVGGRWNGWAIHLPGAFDAYENITVPQESKKLLLIPCNEYYGMHRPFNEVNDVCLRWYDYWLKGIDTGILDEPPILIFVQGINQWRYEKEWPLNATEWTKFFLRENGKLSTEPSCKAADPQVFLSDPWADATSSYPVPKAIFETEPLTQSTEVTGPIALYWFASIESKGISARTWRSEQPEPLSPMTTDTDWYLKLFDVDVDGSVRCLAEGWLKASHYELDETHSKPYAPYHPHVRSLPIEPGKILLYTSDLRMSSNVFLTGHKIRLEISAQDQIQAIWYHLPHMDVVKHSIYCDEQYPSYLLLPVIPRGYTGAGEPAYPPAGPFDLPQYKRNGK